MLQIKEHKPKIFWVAKNWKRWLRRDGKVEMFTTKSACEKYHLCEAVKIRNFID